MYNTVNEHLSTATSQSLNMLHTPEPTTDSYTTTLGNTLPVIQALPAGKRIAGGPRTQVISAPIHCLLFCLGGRLQTGVIAVDDSSLCLLLLSG